MLSIDYQEKENVYKSSNTLFHPGFGGFYLFIYIEPAKIVLTLKFSFEAATSQFIIIRVTTVLQYSVISIVCIAQYVLCLD